MSLPYAPRDSLAALISFMSTLTFGERKALITLSRSQSVPDPGHSPILYQKTKPFLDKLSRNPPFTSMADSDLIPISTLIFKLLLSPLTTGILIVFALGVQLSDSEISHGILESLTKELLATQTVRRDPTWNWDSIFSADRRSVIHPLFPALSPLQRTFGASVSPFFRSYSGRIIRPHYTNRGVSSETAALLLNRISKGRLCVGNPRTFQLVASGVVVHASSVSFEDKSVISSTGHDVNLQSWRYRRYIDHDDPRAPHLSDKTSSWLENGISSSRASLSPEPDMFLDY